MESFRYLKWIRGVGNVWYPIGDAPKYEYMAVYEDFCVVVEPAQAGGKTWGEKNFWGWIWDGLGMCLGRFLVGF